MTGPICARCGRNGCCGYQWRTLAKPDDYWSQHARDTSDNPWRWETAWWNRRTGEASWEAHETFHAALIAARALVAERHQGVVVQQVNTATHEIRGRVEL